ncbi:hypothetical protein HKD37_15G044021 [Glycine soja]
MPSTIANLPNLRILSIQNCVGLEEIYGSDNESDGLCWAFMKLEELTLESLPSLRSFCQGSYSFKFPSLQKVQFPNSETVEISIMNDGESIWPNHILKINIYKCENMDFVFPTSAAKALRQHQFLKIGWCGIKNIFEKSDITSDMTHVYLEKITVAYCQGMKTIIPSFVLFLRLDELIVSNCHTLVNIITPSTTTSLPNLRILRIIGCDELEEIYGSSNEGDGAVLDEIPFMKLEELTLNNLPRLTSFCQGSYDFRFPSLQIVRLEDCPKMETFCQGNITTPSLTKVKYGRIEYDWHKIEYDRHMLSGYDQQMLSEYDQPTLSEDHWYGDLNTTVRSVFTKKDQYRDREKLDILDIRNNNNLKSIWPNQVTPNSFPDLTQIVIYSCKGQYVFPINVAKVLRQLQVLEISCCTIENIVEESDNTCDMTVVFLQVRYCDRMMTIVPSSALFHSLDELHVSMCHSLKNIITPSTIANLLLALTTHLRQGSPRPP